LLNPFDLDFDVFLTQFVPKLTFNQFSKYLIEIKIAFYGDPRRNFSAKVIQKLSKMHTTPLGLPLK